MAAAISLSALSSSLLSRPFHSIYSPGRRLRTLPRLVVCSSPSIEFDISFAPPKPRPKPAADPGPDPGRGAEFISGAGLQLFIPWIVRGEDGNLKLQSHPPASVVNAIVATEKTGKKKKKEVKGSADVEPKHSKAARRFYNSNFRDQPQRLSKVLAAAGVASRRSSEELILEGRVTVNGSTRVDPTKDIIYVNGNRLPKRLPPKVYLALNKPKGYICSAGAKESKSVLELFNDYLKSWPELFAGHNVLNWKLFQGRTFWYLAAVEGEVHKRHLMAISEGTAIDGVHCTPESVELLPRQLDMPRLRLRIVVHEGRNHEVRELVKNAGLEIYSLKRVRIGGFRLPTDLRLGKHIELKPADLRALGWKG
ncbi:hypothetical protein CDL15_Pgr026074 [Punica granatum]|uniref:RNA-binding S4 domain-containing protein n=1 Tax=Punica granatum TaxID=22663 RepID=A0A218WBH3_PUNGR|nr:hypothetical protein CDL15_Pgr026074 [Punica granatum]